MRHRVQTTIVAAAIAAVWATASADAQERAKANWLTDGYDKERTSWQRHETILSPSTVGRMTLLWKVKLDTTNPVYYFAIVGVLLGARVWKAATKRRAVAPAGARVAPQA